jgi:hypothetical protein
MCEGAFLVTNVETLTNWHVLADEQALERTVRALQGNGFNVIVVNSGADAKREVLGLIPDGSDVFTISSVSLNETGIAAEINESGRYLSIRKQLTSMDRATQGTEMRKLASTPSFILGSVHAITEQGHVFVASGSGSQLPGYAYGAGKVIWVVGTQKIVADANEALKRLEEHSLRLEDERMRKTNGRGSSINKLFIARKEPVPGRTTIVLVRETLGF